MKQSSKVGAFGDQISPRMYISVKFFDEQTNYLLGRLKTIIDASISDPAQNKALKDLISIEVWGRRNYIVDDAGIQNTIINDGTTHIV